MNGVMGLANAQRALNYIRILAEFISQPQYAEVVSMFGVVNEPLNSAIGRQNLRSLWVLLWLFLIFINGALAVISRLTKQYATLLVKAKGL